MIHHLNLVVLVIDEVGSPEEVQNVIFLVVDKVVRHHFRQSFRFPALYEPAQFQLVVIIDKFGEVRKMVRATVGGYSLV